MNIFKKLNYLVLALGFVVFTACEDDFTQDDLLELQQSQLDAAIASLNNNGQFASAIIQVVTYDGAPVSGVTVTLANAVDSSGAQSATTDASGVASFSSVVAGGNWISISGADIIDLLATANIGSIEYEVLNGSVIPIKSSGSAVIPVFPTTGTETATISGQATIQTNLTSATAEYADGIEVRANISAYNGDREGISGNFELETLQFAGTNSIGSATTDSVGGYSMVVPAPAGGISYTIAFPDIERDQVLGVSVVNGSELGSVQLDTVSTVFGPNSSNWGCCGFVDQNQVVNAYNGVNVTISDPPAQGRGLGLTFTRLGRDWSPGVTQFNDAAGYGVDADGAIIKATSRGAGYTASPQVTITDASGTGVFAFAHGEYAISGLAIETGDVTTGYANDVAVTFEARYRSVSWGPTTTSATATDTTVGYTDNLNFTLQVQTNNSGEITADSVAAALAAAVADSSTDPADQGYDPDNPQQIADWIYDLELFDSGVNGNSQLSLNVTSVSVGRVYQIGFDFAPGVSVDNDLYINPSISFSGGGATTQTAWTIESFETFYSVAPDNSALTAGYTLLPEDIQYEYYDATVNSASGESFISGSFQRMDVDRTAIGVATGDEWVIFEADSTVSIKAGLTSVETAFRSVSTPVARIFERLEECAHFPPATSSQVTISIGKNGALTAISLPSAGTVTSYAGNDVRVTYGSGYTSAPTVTVTSVFGSGATLYANGNFAADEEYSFTSIGVLNGGSGYRENVNYVDETSAESNPSVFVRAGDEVSANYYYGTGTRTENVQ